eukprot:TRINITY_DN339_c0_g1_i1.p1 TRINITY_DN339_c0_g1~~TRINITY_DN339_c0_g1_i1.p1  ORF type:complete len:187 (+),score=0.41 TRINITY_DN339_c0_g1_i1:31-561(+)
MTSVLLLLLSFAWLIPSEPQGDYPKCYVYNNPSYPLTSPKNTESLNPNTRTSCYYYCKYRRGSSFYFGLSEGLCLCWGSQPSGTVVGSNLCNVDCGSGKCGGEGYVNIYSSSNGASVESDPSVTGSGMVGVDNSMNPGVIGAIAVGAVVVVVLVVVVVVVVVRKRQAEEEVEFSEM